MRRIVRWAAEARNWALDGLHHRQVVAELAILVAVVAAGIWIRLHFAVFLDPFEDGHQNWWISANLVRTGAYWDRHSMMTQGNWLPLYHFWGTAILGLAGWHDLAALKLGNIALSVLTAGLVYALARRTNPAVGIAAAAFFSLNFIDVVVSGWSTAESLATFLVLVGYAALFRSDASLSRNLWIGGAAFSLAVLTRYEAWLVVALAVGFAVAIRKGEPQRAILVGLLPAVVVMIGYFLYALQWGFLPEIVVRQTSTDIRFQLAQGTQAPPDVLLSRFWTGYAGFFPGVLAVGTTTALVRLRHDVGGWIVLAILGFIVVYTTLRFGNPSYRYVMISVPFLSLFAAEGLASGIRWLRDRIRRSWSSDRLRAAALAVGVVGVCATLLAAPITYWDAGFEARRLMEPLQRAGLYLSGVPLPQGKLLITESPIAAYYSGYPAERMLGSRWLPDDRTAALTFLRENAAFVVYVGVPYYVLRTLFPELQNATSTADFELLFDGGGATAGIHAVFVYRVLG